MAGGLFITLEGGEGTGKSTQVRRLAARLEAAGHDVVLTREPGGTPAAEDIRGLLVTGEPERWSPVAEALLNYAARDAHLKATIRPALALGNVVVCDRFMDFDPRLSGFCRRLRHGADRSPGSRRGG